MTARPDDDALSWSGDDDPTLAVGGGAEPAVTPVGAASVAPTSLPEGYTAVGKGSDALTAASTDAPSLDSARAAASVDASRSMGNAALVGIGVLAGVYLILTIGWMLGGARLQLIGQLFLDPIAYAVTFWLAVAAPAIWFFTVYRLTVGRAAWLRFALLIGGAVVLVPWPFVLAGALV